MHLPTPVSVGAELELAVHYRCAPRRGLYFMGPDATHPDRPLQCWTQGQDDDSRYYWPCLDTPIEKATTEIICTPRPPATSCCRTASCARRVELPGSTQIRWHYALDFPHPPYLVTLVCGPLRRAQRQGATTGVDVYYFVPPGREADARRTFGRTPEMIDLFSERIGVPYPHALRQVVVRDFIFGGMENTTATTMTEHIAARRARGARLTSDDLIAHELAHQWFGDLVTCRDWSRGLAQRGLRDLLGVRLARAPPGPRRVPTTSCWPTPTATWARPGRYRRPDRLPGLRGADRPLRPPPLREGRAASCTCCAPSWATSCSGARSALREQARARLGRDARPGARHRGGLGPQLREFFDRWIAAPGPPRAGGALGVGRRAQGRHAAPGPEAGHHAGGPAVRVLDATCASSSTGASVDEPVTVARRRTPSSSGCRPGPTQVIFDPGRRLLKASRWRSRGAVAPPARGRRAGHRPRLGRAGAGRLRRAGVGRGAGRRAGRDPSGPCAPRPPAPSDAPAATTRSTR